MEEKRVSVITGACGGIGREVVKKFYDHGYHVVLLDMDLPRLEQAAGELGLDRERASCWALDISDEGQVKDTVAAIRSKLGRIDVLVNTAGIAGQIQIQDIPDEQWDRYLSVNLGGARNTIQAVLPHMLHVKAGSIVNISSIWGLRGASCEVAYACTKAALIGLTRSLALELAPSQIRVNCVAPGVINTDMVQVLGQETLRQLAEETPLGRLGTPEDVAHAVVFLASDKASFLTGQVLGADGGFIV